MKLMLPKLRAGFAAFYVPESFPGSDGAPAYQTALIIPPKSPAVKMLDDAVLKVATEKWKGKAAAILKTLEADRKKCAWQKSEYTNDEGVPYDGFEDVYYLRARNEIQPLLLNQSAEEVLRGQPEAPYSGCYVIAQVDIWTQDNAFGKGIRCKLLGVQFAGDGDAFAGGPSKSKQDDFQSLAVSQDEDEDADEFA